jgi:cysteine-rich repeat protein
MSCIWQHLKLTFLCAILWANASCDLDTETDVCPDGRRCPVHFRCSTSGQRCVAPSCGNGIVDAAMNELCDDGPEGSASCDSDCSWSDCGDNFLNRAAGEECDDDNRISGDGCGASCQLE